MGLRRGVHVGLVLALAAATRVGVAVLGTGFLAAATAVAVTIATMSVAVPASTVPATTVAAMRYGSVIIDLAGEMGGNCELSSPGETVVHDGVTILAPLNLASEMAYHASTMYSKNVSALLEHLAPQAALKVDLEDEITRGACVTHEGQVVHEATRALLNHEVSV